MKRYPAGEFKTHCLRLMEQVRKHREPLEITRKGTPIARLVPVDEGPNDIFGCLEGELVVTGDGVSPVVALGAWEALKK